MYVTVAILYHSWEGFGIVKYNKIFCALGRKFDHKTASSFHSSKQFRDPYSIPDEDQAVGLLLLTTVYKIPSRLLEGILYIVLLLGLELYIMRPRKGFLALFSVTL